MTHSVVARRLVMAVALFCTALPALPQTRTYTVEVLVFRNDGTAGALREGEGAVLVAGDDVEATPVTGRKLSGSIGRLNNGGLRVLGHAAWTQAPVAPRSRRGVSTEQLGIAGTRGKLILELRGQNLFLAVDLVVEDGGRRYRIDQGRQIKLDEVHYFDHPAVGVLAVVSRGD